LSISLANARALVCVADALIASQAHR